MRTMVSIAIAGLVMFIVGVVSVLSTEMFSTGYNIGSTLLLCGFFVALFNSVSAFFLYEKK